eukprot:7641790-Karenia_brevis.AAC.1
MPQEDAVAEATGDAQESLQARTASPPRAASPARSQASMALSAVPVRESERDAKANAANYHLFMLQQQAAPKVAEPKPTRQAESLAVVPRRAPAPPRDD